METEEDQFTPQPERVKRARRTHFWTHLCLAVVSLALAGLIYQATSRRVPVVIFAVAGIIEIIHAFVNPFKKDGK